MWPPPNIYSLPSKKEIQKAKEEISTIELEIVEVELRLDALRKSLSERKAWIAPIRTTPPEILSLIFIEASRTDWKAPLVLQSICRQWRDVIVDSPEAWKFIPLSKFSSERRSDLISLFLERSHNTALHISVKDDSLLEYVELLADRIECFDLIIPTRVLLECYLQSGHTFHRLERLKIWHWNAAEDVPAAGSPAAWDMSLFPNLKVLDIISQSSSLLRAIPAASEFPAIRHLTLNCDPLELSDILIKCAASLESVHLTYRTWQSEGLDREYKIHFPCLKYLRLGDWSDVGKSRFRIKAATPNLQEYLDEGRVSTLNTIKVDTGSVMLLYVVHTPDLSQYPRLVTLGIGAQHWVGEEVIKAIECLRTTPPYVPTSN